MDNNSLSLVLLQSLGFTHRELRTYFLETENPLKPSSLLETLSHNILKPLMKEEKSVKVLESRTTLHEEKTKNTLESKNIEVIDWHHPLYPERLKPIGHAPYFFYLRGNLKENIPLLAVVGSRKHTNYADRTLRSILPPLIEEGFGIVSGGAYGVDTLSHRITLEQ